jgi:hypothetical protein
MKRNTNKGLEQDGRLQPAQVTDAWTLSSQKVQVLSELDWTGLVQRLCLAAREKIVFCPWMGNAHEDRDLEEDQYQEVI